MFLEQFVGQNVNTYHLERLLGTGQESAVYQARQQETQRVVTLTLLVLPPNLSDRERQRFSARLLRIAPDIVTIHHRQLFPLHDYGEWSRFIYLVTPPFPQQSLATLVEQYGPCNPPVALALLEQMVAGLEYAHCRGFVHGALGLSNLFLVQAQGLQIAGLGVLSLLEKRSILLAARPEEQTSTLMHSVFVARGFMAPECSMAGQVPTIRSDIYSLGAVLYKLLTGFSHQEKTADSLFWNQPVPSGSGEQDSLLSETMAEVLRRALSPDPDRRFRRVSDLLAAFAKAVAEENPSRTLDCSLCPLLADRRAPDSSRHSQESLALAYQPDMAFSSSTQPKTNTFSSYSNTLMQEKRDPALSSAHTYTRRGRASAHHPHVLSRRRIIDLAVRGTVFSTLGASLLGAGYLLTTALHQPSAQPSPGLRLATPPLNSATIFTNPGNGQQGLLIHLPDGRLVAYERACTHIYVPVNYNSQNHLLVCPAHLAVFDPAREGKVLKGPAKRPLPEIAVQKEDNGTVIIGAGNPLPQTHE